MCTRSQTVTVAAMSGVISSTELHSGGSMALLAYLVPFVGSLVSLFGLPAAIASRWTSSVWVDRGLLLGVFGTLVALIGSALTGMWPMIPATLIVVLAS